ncbi:MAG: hypothetical protein IKB34_05840 [Clostridia bacterium]|nr:hypothetical protein [Clostridia bacterium]
MIITFIGHGTLRINSDLSKKIVTTLKSNIEREERIIFYFGGYGDFDNHCASICRKIKKEKSGCEIVFVTPYITQSQQEKIKYLINAKLYDSTLYPPIENTPPRYAIIKRNEWMVSEADLVIAYVSHTYGGAYKTLRYARSKNKKIINLAE